MRKQVTSSHGTDQVTVISCKTVSAMTYFVDNKREMQLKKKLQWRHNEHDGVSNNQTHEF